MVNLQAELSYLQAHLGTLQVPAPPPPPPQPMSAISIADLPTASPAYDTLSSLFDPTTTVQPAWPMQQPRHFGGAGRDPADDMSSSPPAGSGVLQELTRHLMHRPPQGC